MALGFRGTGRFELEEATTRFQRDGDVGAFD